MERARGGAVSSAAGRRLGEALSVEERRAAFQLVRRLRREVRADLVQATLFGSKARGEARPDSDIDVLAVFRRLPPDREPQASHAEAIAEEVAERTGVPVTIWSVSLPDLERGQRTPMLVDALHDGIPLWWRGEPIVPPPFTPDDALRCVASLLDRVAEGSDEVAEHLARGHLAELARRLRDDLVRMCIALHLLRGRTEPRRGEAPALLLRSGGRWPPGVEPALAWAAGSYGADGRDEDAPVPPPPGGVAGGVRAVEGLRQRVERGARALARAPRGGEPPPRPGI